MKSTVKKTGIAIAGTFLVVLGLLLSLPLVPGPGLLIALAGLVLLSREFDWARRWTEPAERKLKQWRQKNSKSKKEDET